MQIIIGTSGWIYREWRGEFYPKSLPQSEWIQYYQKYFDIVEINATFYRFFADHIYLKWKENAGDNFKYIVKVPRYITHLKYLKDCDDSIKRFCKSVALLGNTLALILLQLSPRMPYDLARLEKAILAFDNPRQIVVEFRDVKWMTNEVKQLLIKLGCIYCSADSPTIQLNDWVTSSIAYIRLHGRRQWYNHNYSIAELHEIIKVIKKMTQHGAGKIYILFNNDYYAYAIHNALTLKKLIQKNGEIGVN